jgi:hypothetical protein
VRALSIGGRIEVRGAVRRDLAEPAADDRGDPELRRAQVGHDDEVRVTSTGQHLHQRHVRVVTIIIVGTLRPG